MSSISRKMEAGRRCLSTKYLIYFKIFFIIGMMSMITTTMLTVSLKRRRNPMMTMVIPFYCLS